MRIAGIPIDDKNSRNDQDTCRALSSWFLATVIGECERWISTHEQDRVKNRRIVWSANVGVPVEHYDSDALKSFKEVLGVAWRWHQQAAVPSDLVGAIDAYNAVRSSLTDQPIDCHALPEIAAAVQSFVISREEQHGIYIYFDIGGGTVDGAAFDFLSHNGERRVNFYSGRVTSLGTAALLGRLDSKGSFDDDPAAMQRFLETCDHVKLAECGDELQQLVACVVMTAKRKDHRNWCVDAIQGSDLNGSRIGSLEPSRMRALVIFIGGGGSRLNWYQSTIKSTYADFQHNRAGIPPYSLAAVPKPKDLEMRGIGDEAFGRFSIAYGLSIPYGEGPDIGLPSQFEDAPPPARWQPPHAVDYLDSKDVYE
jgi:hypothetical protein